jgi:1-deoxy-D-xylulose-5-phosphate reductoisomerase
VEHLGSRYRIEALAAKSNGRLLAEQVRRFEPRVVVFGSQGHQVLEHACSEVGAELLLGDDGLGSVASGNADVVLNALVGAAGLVPTLEALWAGKTVALANKESLVIGGNLVVKAAGRELQRLIPVDSEHASLHISLQGRDRKHIQALWLTASGGALRDYDGDLASVTPKEALAHPTWNMGPKITIDSATMMNKGLEVIEAHYLFDLPVADIGVVIHEQSIVHSLVELCDGSVIAHMACPDMRGPIQYALTYPDLQPSRVEPLLPRRLTRLDFSIPSPDRYPCLALSRQAAEVGGTALAVLNAANEVVVDLFLEERLAFVDIARVIEAVLEKHTANPEPDLAEILATDAWARESARKTALEGTR